MGESLSISRVIWEQRKKWQLNHIVSEVLRGHGTHVLPNVSEAKPDTKVKNVSQILASSRKKSLQGE